jgi:opine dehydrogenase
MRIGIIGGGNGGLALAAELKKQGHYIHLWNRSSERVKPIIDANNFINVDDKENKYSVRIDMIDFGYPVPLNDVELIFIITPSIAHEDIGEHLSQSVSDKIPIILMPGRTFGSYAFLNSAKKTNKEYKGVCIETQTLLHACRAYGKEVTIFGKKKKIIYTSHLSIPQNVQNTINNLLDVFEYNENYLEVTLSNVGAFFHPVPTILNSGWIESGNIFQHYKEGITPRIANYIEKMDREKGEICRKLNIKHISLAEWLKQEYGTHGDSLYECLQNCNAYEGINAPNTLNHRYINDDLITGLVPIYKTALKFGIEVPIIESFLQFACKYLDYDFINKGREFPESLL